MNSLQLKIRSFEPTDTAAVWSLHNEALEGTGAHGGNGPWDEDVRDPQAAYLDRGGEFLVGLLGLELVAMGALACSSGPGGEIKRMRVAPQHQHRGLGTLILLALEGRAIELGLSQLKLDTTTKQTAAQRFYLTHGYSEFRRGTLGRFELIFYEKQLTPNPDSIPDVRDGLTRLERVILLELRQQERQGRNLPTAQLYGRVVEHVNVSVAEFQRVLQRLAAR